MKLLRLCVFVDGTQIREIKFREGLNLVLNKRGVGRSGNSVGKTTLARVMDYLLMGPIGPIYIDEEFKKPNEKIESLFTHSIVYVELDFIGLDNQQHSISRNLSIEPANRAYYVDRKLVDDGKYEHTLMSLFFDVKSKRPSVRSLVPKFIRSDSHKMLNTIKFLDKRMSGKDYSELFLYLFGFADTNLLTEKRDLTNRVNLKKKHSQTLNALVKEQKPKAEMQSLKIEAQEIERAILRFDYSPKIRNPLDVLRDIQNEEDAVTAVALEVDRKISNIRRTVELLERQGGNYIVNEVRAIYEYAKVSVGEAIKDFEDVLAFHDQLVIRKRQFLGNEIPLLGVEQEVLDLRLEEINGRRKEIFSEMRSTEAIKKITEDIKVLSDLKTKIGRLEGLLEQQEKASSELESANEELKKTLFEIAQSLDSVRKFTARFNRYFRRITNLIHAHPYKFTLAYNEDTGLCEMGVESNVSNPEGGKKKAEVIAFDLAYARAVAKLSLPRPTFVFHDSIEDIDQKQIELIFRCAEKNPGQEIISMLSDRLSDDMYRKYLPNAVLLLAEDDMFFKV